MMEKIVNLLSDKPITFPRFLLENYHKLKINNDELIMIIYLLNEDSIIYNPMKISADLNIELPQVLGICESLKSKDILTIETKKVHNKIEEHLSFKELYKKMGLLMVNIKEEKETNIYDIFENEFGRTLSSMEYEIIDAWRTTGGFSEELIVAALKEATYNGVSNLRYIDKILYEWNKKGIKTKQDIEENRKRFTRAKEKPTELYEYDWLNED